MKYNFTKVEPKLLTGETVPNVHQALANAIYTITKDLGLVSIAQSMYKGEDVEISQVQLDEVKRIIQDEKTGFFAFVQKSLLDYIEKA